MPSENLREGIVPLRKFFLRRDPQKAHPWVNPRVTRYRGEKLVRPFDLGALRKKLTKKVAKAHVSRMCRETPSTGIPIKFGAFGDLAELVNHSTFHVDRSTGLDFTGCRTKHVPTEKTSRPYNQCIALPCMHVMTRT
jgi:hypothetical protein